ncbi:MarR family transcriptional regulator [Rhodopseudomonas parapalustris]
MAKKNLVGSASLARIDSDFSRRFMSVVASLSVYLDELRQLRARRLGISGPQFAILLTVLEAEEEQGVSVRNTAKAMLVDPSFITTQSKLLEKKGLLLRKIDEVDARVVKLSLTDRAYKQIASTAADEQALHDFIFDELTNEKLEQLVVQLTSLKNRLEKACIKFSAGL